MVSKRVKIMLGLLLVAAIAFFLKHGGETEKSPQKVVPQKKVPYIKEDVFDTQNYDKKVIKSFELDPFRTIFITGEIGNNAINAALAIENLNKKGKEPINLVVTSPGGSVVAGAVLLSAMEASQAKVNVICKAFCASMAAIILQYGEKRLATDRTILMYHPAYAGTEGDVDRMHSHISMIKDYINKMEATVADRMGMSFEYYKELTANELWIDSEDAKNKGYIDDLVSLEEKESDNTVLIFQHIEEDPDQKAFNKDEQKINKLNIKW